MKRRELIRELTRNGCYLLRRGRNHDIYINPRTGRKAPVPRHKEIPDSVCRMVRTQLGMK